MGGGDLNMKKSWHPLLHVNQERVWKQEKKALEERKKLEELRRERQQEREMQELQRLQEEAGGKKRLDKIDWMYATPAAANAPSANDLEDYLLGKKRVDQMLRGDEAQKVSKSDTSSFISLQNANTARDTAAKVREDPMLAIKQQEQAAYEALLRDPTRLRQMRQKAGLPDTADRKESKEERRRRKDEKRRRREEQADHRGHASSSSSRHHRDRDGDRDDDRHGHHRSSHRHRHGHGHGGYDDRDHDRRDDSGRHPSRYRSDDDRRNQDRGGTGGSRDHGRSRSRGSPERYGRREEEDRSRPRRRSPSPPPREGDSKRARRDDGGGSDRGCNRDERNRAHDDDDRAHDADRRAARRQTDDAGYPPRRRSRSPRPKSPSPAARADRTSPPPQRRADDGRSAWAVSDRSARDRPDRGPYQQPWPPSSGRDGGRSSSYRPGDSSAAPRSHAPTSGAGAFADAGVDAEAAAAAERQRKLDEMMNNAKTLDEQRNEYLTRVRDEEAAAAAREDELRARLLAAKARGSSDGRGQFLLDEQRRAGVGDLGERLKRGRGGLQRLD
ncbi:uncharacterized protein PSFLO_05429 [Pseudozyma flocculosa]|uniref:CBF1-interacting co-repressor CIR N-terminal domain-containing protein n=1 Tax=Pseudozyma flocculosa TaxID=84751 RepID=A0A5C3F897_9BASI|nr:uncharacterized protein PSFLO_05429 [Pseudozyma flocculosa]